MISFSRPSGQEKPGLSAFLFSVKEVCFHMTKGRIHSIESMGLVDGPGIRTVVFLQECYLRCCYCHNPDTWSRQNPKAIELSPEELLQKLSRFRTYYGKNGGVTFSGGEPLLQPAFLQETLALCKKAGIHTCLDTAGCGIGDYEKILKNTDLILMDIKHYTAQGYQKITGHSPNASMRFLDTVIRMEIPMWIRHVVVPGLTDSEEHLVGLETYLRTLRNIQRVELLPYHTMGIHKYTALEMPYPLEDVPALDSHALDAWNERLNRNCTKPST